MTSENPYEGYRCPVCGERSVETVVKIPSVRGYVLAYQLSTRRLPACVPCARSAMLKEAGRSALLGWFSISALVMNPFLILWNLGRAPFVGPNAKALKAAFDEAGIPESGARPDLLRVLYGLAAAMITADGEIAPEEVDTALAAGGKVSPKFDPKAFHETVERHAELPSAEAYGALLAGVMSEENKRLVAYYLTVIALADGEFARSEETLLRRIATAMKVDPGWLDGLIADTKAKAEQAKAMAA